MTVATRRTERGRDAVLSFGYSIVTRARLNPSCRARVVLEIRRGRRLVTMDPQNLQAVCELMTPTLTAIEWALKPEKLELPDAALAEMREMVDTPAEPNARLRAAVKRRRR